jgi:hypothetical protein
LSALHATESTAAVPRRRRAWWKYGGAGVVLIAVLAAVALRRGGLLALQSVPAGVTAERAGLAGLAALAARAQALETGDAGADVALRAGAEGMRKLRSGDVAGGLADLRAAAASSPDDLVLGNAYRMAVFRLRREALARGIDRVTLAARMPPALDGEPLRSLQSLAREHPSREAKLQLALAWVDEMLLFPALEIKAPASVESVDILSGILAAEPAYVPALYGRGLNYLHRPARLVWPEADKDPPDAASRDLGTCVAIGQRLGGGSQRLQASLALALGDAYAKEGKAERARSWWQIARNLCREADLADAVQRRLRWNDKDLFDRLEEELEGRMLDLEHPMTDLALMWR